MVSTANIGQLAVDLLISSLDLHRIGTFDPRDLVPVVGAREDDEPGVTTPLERNVLSYSAHPFFAYRLSLWQTGRKHRRGPAKIPGAQGNARSHKTHNLLMPFAPEPQGRVHFGLAALHPGVRVFSGYIPLGGGYLEQDGRTDVVRFPPERFIRQIDTTYSSVPTYKLAPPGTPSWDSSPLAIFGQLPLPTYTYISQPPLAHLREGGIAEAVPFIPGGGLTRRILSSFPQQWPTPVLSLLQFAFEGDNRADAQSLASIVCKLFNAPPTENGTNQIQWRHPKSWNGGLFGTPHDQTLYG